MRQLRTSGPGLKHLPFFEALAEAGEGTPAFHAATAGLLTLRLVDHWVAIGPVMVEPESASVSSARAAIMTLPANDPQREILIGLVNTMQTLREVDVQPVLPRIFAFAGTLERRGSLALAVDAYECVIRLGEESFDGELLIDSYLRAGYCWRALGSLPEAERTYGIAEKMAKRCRQPARIFRSRIGLANVAVARGNLPNADEMLGQIALESSSARCRSEHAMALHSRSVVAQRRGDLSRAVCLSYDALQIMDYSSERDRVLNDIGAYFIVMEKFDAARDALLVLEATTTLETVRSNAQVNLLALAARSDDRASFEKLRERLDGRELLPETSVNYLIESARGHWRFGQPDLATVLLERARGLAKAHGLNRSLFESENMLLEMATELHYVSNQTAADIRDPAAHVIQGLRLMAAAVAG